MSRTENEVQEAVLSQEKTRDAAIGDVIAW